MAAYSNLTETSVSVMDDTKGVGWRMAYVNSEAGREALLNDYPDVYSLITSGTWGDHPLFAEEEFYHKAVCDEASLLSRVENLEQTVDTMLGGGT